MAVCITEWVERAHESEERMELALGDFPMLLEQVEWQDSRNLLLSGTDSKGSFFRVVESTVGILVKLQVVDG